MFPLLSRLQDEKHNLQEENHGEYARYHVSIAQYPCRPEARKIEENSRHKKDLYQRRWTRRTAVLKIGEDEQAKCRDQGQDTPGKSCPGDHAMASGLKRDQGKLEDELKSKGKLQSQISADAHIKARGN